METTGTISVPTLTTDIPEVVTLQEDGDFQNETVLSIEIAQLWDNQVALQSNEHATRKESREIRAGLGEKLFSLKRLQASRGRGGQWSQFLRQMNIARATADRLINAHKKSLEPTICVDESIPESPEETTRALVRKLWPTQESLYSFILGLATTAGDFSHELREEGILVFKPTPEFLDPVPVIDRESVEVGGDLGEVI